MLFHSQSYYEVYVESNWFLDRNDKSDQKGTISWCFQNGSSIFRHIVTRLRKRQKKNIYEGTRKLEKKTIAATFRATDAAVVISDMISRKRYCFPAGLLQHLYTQSQHHQHQCHCCHHLKISLIPFPPNHLRKNLIDQNLRNSL